MLINVGLQAFQSKTKLLYVVSRGAKGLPRKPYFQHFFRWSSFLEITGLLNKGGASLIETGYLIVVATLCIAILCSILLILTSLRCLNGIKQKPRNCVKRHYVFGYFFAIGLGFLLIEIAFMQKFILFLHHPVYAASATLTAFFVFAGADSACSDSLSRKYGLRLSVSLAIICIVGLSLGYLLKRGSPLEPVTPIYCVSLKSEIVRDCLLTLVFKHSSQKRNYYMLYQEELRDYPVLLILPNIFIWASTLSMPTRFFLAICLIAPLAFFMGMPMPLALASLARHAEHLIPWAWGINGCASVISSVLAVLLAMQSGFSMVILVAVMLYLMVIYIFSYPDKTASSPYVTK